ncbi:hypothetical protein Agabi119p4_840 [Agaricus bisporus var. burnettii]|uniref:26S proteasome regulatory subunit RPN2 n=1 Tax=Agaricus bisporus var. burnettii TaxID=192524 RepID=A0A8H7KL53_AGABI|nr:hypothetical protein Agabi119p4_840 [Agaricus bisporus var. burnettii]
MVRQQSSAGGVLALLQEPDIVFKRHALKALNPLVPQFWAEISDHIALIESLYEGDDLPKDARDQAALLASKVYYYLGEYDDALSFALGAGNAFNEESRTPGSEEYIETIVSKAIDRYIELRSEEHSGLSKEKIDSRLQLIIEGIFKRCISEGEFKQAIGIALESRRLDIVSAIYKQTNDVSLLAYAMEAALDTGSSLSYRDHVLRFLFPLFPQLTVGEGSAHVHALTRLLVALSDVSLTVPLLSSLVEKEELLAYQLAFDLVEGGSQDYLESIRTELPEGDLKTKEVYDKLRAILSGKESVKLYLEFLKRNNQTDLLILKSSKDALDPRSSVYHVALTLQNAFMHAGTTSDIFLRENLEWLGLANNWSKFSATAGLGVIHKGYFEQGMTILTPYLPTNNETNIQGASYSEGGALYALGLINAGCGSDVTNYLRQTLRDANNEVVQHGAALGLGVAGMGSKSLEAFEDLKRVLFNDSAVAGEASGYAMGLVMLGTAATDPVDEMLQYAHETQHEKIIRGLAMGIAFVYYGRQEEADNIIKTLLAEKDPILRYGGVYTLALAYAGTANNNAVRQLLHIAVSDVSDDVRRAAVTSLAFLLFKNPSQVPRIVQLLSESYNAHVRCGATLALGIALSTSFDKIISDKHEDPMARFGAAIGQGFIDAGGRNVAISLQSRAGSSNTSAIVGMVLFCQFWYWYPLALSACLAFSPTGIIGLNGDLKVPKFEYISNAKPSLFAYPASTKPPKKETITKAATAVLSTTARAKAREKKKAAAEGEAMELDDKQELKAVENDVEMKAEDTASPKDGDVSPINRSLSNLIDEPKPSTTPSPSNKKKGEPLQEFRPNFSRVTPAQLDYISFPPGSRYQPVRPVSSTPRNSASIPGAKGGNKAPSAEKYAGGGGIILLTDLRPDAEAEFIEFEPPPVPALPTAATTIPNGNAVPSLPAPTGPHISLDENAPEAEPPASFEYPFEDDS